MKEMRPPSRRMLTDQQAAEYCGFESVNGFKAYIRVAPVNFGRMVRYDVRDLDDYLDALRQSPTFTGSFSEQVGNGDGAHRGH